MSAIPFADDVLDRDVEVLQLVDVSKQLGLIITRVHQLLRDHQLIAIRRDGVLAVPAAFFDDDGEILSGLPGLLSVLRDGGYGDDEILSWLFRDDETLGGTPVAAMHGHQAREVKRRAQAMAF